MKAIIRIFVLFVAILVLVAVFAVWEGLREEGEPTTTTAASVCQHRDRNDDSRCDTCDDDYTDGIDVVATTTAAVTTAPVGNIMYNSAKNGYFSGGCHDARALRRQLLLFQRYKGADYRDL